MSEDTTADAVELDRREHVTTLDTHRWVVTAKTQLLPKVGLSTAAAGPTVIKVSP